MNARIVTTPRGPIEYAEFGEGPAVLALHGAMGGHDQSSILARSSGAAARFICVSRPGYLGTPLSSGEEPEAQAALCSALLDQLGIAQAAVLAISGGGPCALQFALRHPARCRSLVLISAATATQHTRIPLRFHLLRAMAYAPPLLRVMAARMEEAPERQITKDHPVAGPLHAELQGTLFDHLRHRLPGTHNDIRQTRAPVDYALESLTPPVLLIHGDEDPVVPVEDSRAFVRRVPAARLVELRGGGHAALFTHLDQVRAEAGPFLTHAG